MDKISNAKISGPAGETIGAMVEDRMRDAIAFVNEVLSHLEERLGPVMRKGPGEQKPGDLQMIKEVGTVSDESEMLIIMRMHVAAIHGLALRVNAILSRLDV